MSHNPALPLDRMQKINLSSFWNENLTEAFDIEQSQVFVFYKVMKLSQFHPQVVIPKLGKNSEDKVIF